MKCDACGHELGHTRDCPTCREARHAAFLDAASARGARLDPAVRRHPAYREGFDDALDGVPLPIDATSPYIEGWLSAYECKALLEHGHRGTVRAEYAAWLAKP